MKKGIKAENLSSTGQIILNFFTDGLWIHRETARDFGERSSKRSVSFGGSQFSTIGENPDFDPSRSAEVESESTVGKLTGDFTYVGDDRGPI